jgi:hypothetical protein
MSTLKAMRGFKEIEVDNADCFRVKKLRATPDALFAADNRDTHNYGGINYNSLPVDYEIEGTLAAPLEVGSPARFDRTKRNGVECAGFMTTSILRVIEDLPNGGKKLSTLNSIYLMTPIEK